ncbi:uncharacterized protein LOC108443865 [Pygocentrus nattereri]|uniref:uncharacterized protein LOC108443865 n=1 Tax=Pygocentrus nattereri TaxID=42514 RepID=UPI001890E704|nr:uncharacterized protein LOC108443865 [Pygocentrus nattereri]
MLCGGYTPLFLGGSHPFPQDGIVTREIYGSNGYVADRRQCSSQRSNPIQVKACPGNYYVYRLVKPAVSIPKPTYCAVAFNTPSYDPCNNYTSLDQPWRATNSTGTYTCDKDFNWNGWYRLMYNGMNIRMPESCVDENKCGTITPLWLNGSHPQIEDGIVTRLVCGRSGSDCCYYRSAPIRVRACPGNYYVYEFVRPTLFCSAHCADVSTIMLISTTTMAAISTKLNTTTVTFNDPCNNYTALDQPWRGTNETGLSICDRDFNWNGWYRLLYNGMNIRMPESCVNQYRCGTDITLGLCGSHPQIGDGIVTRGVCINSLWIYRYYYYYYYNGYRDSFMSIRVKACPGNYYVYEFVRPNFCNAAYCADVNTITPSIAPTAITGTAVTADNITFDPCNTSSVLDNDWRSIYNSYRG